MFQNIQMWRKSSEREHLAKIPIASQIETYAFTVPVTLCQVFYIFAVRCTFEYEMKLSRDMSRAWTHVLWLWRRFHVRFHHGFDAKVYDWQAILHFALYMTRSCSDILSKKSISREYWTFLTQIKRIKLRLIVEAFRSLISSVRKTVNFSWSPSELPFPHPHHRSLYRFDFYPRRVLKSFFRWALPHGRSQRPLSADLPRTAWLCSKT